MVHEGHFLPEIDKMGHFFPEQNVRAHLKFIYPWWWLLSKKNIAIFGYKQ